MVYGVIAGKIWRKRIIVTYHGGEAAEYFAKHGVFARRWLKRADKVIVLSGFLKKVFDEYQIPCVVIPNIAKLADAQEHSAYQWEAPRLISVSHLRELYNIPCSLRAYADIKERVPGARLAILGDGPQRHELEQMALEIEENIKNKDKNIENNDYLTKKDESKVTCGNSNSIDPQSACMQASRQPDAQSCSDTDKSYPLDSYEKNSQKMSKNNSSSEGSIQFIGQVDNKEMGRYLAESEIMLSAPHIDNMPVSLMEAMNAGTLVISSRVGGVPFMITEGENGLLFEDDNAEEMASKILQAIKNPKETESMIANAKKDVAKYEWENIRQKLLPLYE